MSGRGAPPLAPSEARTLATSLPRTVKLPSVTRAGLVRANSLSLCHSCLLHYHLSRSMCPARMPHIRSVAHCSAGAPGASHEHYGMRIASLEWRRRRRKRALACSTQGGWQGTDDQHRLVSRPRCVAAHRPRHISCWLLKQLYEFHISCVSDGMRDDGTSLQSKNRATDRSMSVPLSIGVLSRCRVVHLRLGQVPPPGRLLFLFHLFHCGGAGGASWGRCVGAVVQDFVGLRKAAVDGTRCRLHLRQLLNTDAYECVSTLSPQNRNFTEAPQRGHVPDETDPAEPPPLPGRPAAAAANSHRLMAPVPVP